MGLLLWLIVLLAIAWGLADFQLRARIEDDVQQQTASRPAPVVASRPEPNTAPDVSPPAPQNPPSDTADTATDAAPATPGQTAPAGERAPDQ